jgi:hypothetical protein
MDVSVSLSMTASKHFFLDLPGGFGSIGRYFEMALVDGWAPCASDEPGR